LERRDFMTRLEHSIETRTAELIALATGQPVSASALVPAPDEPAGREPELA
jgi:hypothetical protein